MNFFLRKKISPDAFSLSVFISGLAILLIFTAEPVNKMYPSHSLLCLGDSYTIGESVATAENFPNQTIQLLRREKYEFGDPEIVAKTGWTTDELQDAIHTHHFMSPYDFVTLLIGVNNQYRGRTIAGYRLQFESLLKQAIQFANGKTTHVIAISIPDWGVTPFAKNSGRDREKISSEIDLYNDANKKIANDYKVNYINVTPGTREAENDLSLLANDGLHPSGKEYAIWAKMVSAVIKSQLN